MRLACELPDVVGRSLSQWDCRELARQLVRDGIVAAISPQTVRRILAGRRLKPWRQHLWLRPRAPPPAMRSSSAARGTWPTCSRARWPRTRPS